MSPYSPLAYVFVSGLNKVPYNSAQRLAKRSLRCTKQGLRRHQNHSGIRQRSSEHSPCPQHFQKTLRAWIISARAIRQPFNLVPLPCHTCFPRHNPPVHMPQAKQSGSDYFSKLFNAFLASSSPCSAALRHHFTASLISFETPSPLA